MPSKLVVAQHGAEKAAMALQCGRMSAASTACAVSSQSSASRACSSAAAASCAALREAAPHRSDSASSATRIPQPSQQLHAGPRLRTKIDRHPASIVSETPAPPRELRRFSSASGSRRHARQMQIFRGMRPADMIVTGIPSPTRGCPRRAPEAGCGLAALWHTSRVEAGHFVSRMANFAVLRSKMPLLRRCMVSSSRLRRVRCEFPFRSFPVLHENDWACRTTGGSDPRMEQRAAARMSSSPDGRGSTKARQQGMALSCMGIAADWPAAWSLEFRRLHLADLPLAHRADGHDEQQI